MACEGQDGLRSLRPCWAGGSPMFGLRMALGHMAAVRETGHLST